LFQFHHQPFAYFARYAPGTPGRSYLKDEVDFFRDLATGSFPAVAFVKPIGDDNEHPGYSTVAAGQQQAAKLVNAVQASPIWPHTVIIVTYDEHGGRWDHVPPPIIDRWGPGLRVPTVIISPFAKKGFVDHTPYETVSILKFIETRWGSTAARRARPASRQPHPGLRVLRWVFPSALAPPHYGVELMAYQMFDRKPRASGCANCRTTSGLS
jgi:acid phosphatase